MLAPLQLGHRHEIVREQSIRLDQGARRSFERGVAEPMTEAQKMLLENRFLGNVGVFREIRFQRFGVGFVRRRDITHFSDPSDRNERGRSIALNSLTSYRWHIYMSSNLDFWWWFSFAKFYRATLSRLSERAYIRIWSYRSYIEMN